ncbi:MAG: hypothetical protein K2O01_01380, partial [Bacteroidales bacterium]|nr:hypothetical protein [Bacteroidales bacterium]
TYTRNTVASAVLTMTRYSLHAMTRTLNIKIRANGSGRIENYDLSPLVAGIIRDTFNADGEHAQSTVDYGYNAWRWSLSVNGSDVASGDVAFGAGEVAESHLLAPYLLRRNTATINAYIGLPIQLSQWHFFSMTLYDATFNTVKVIKGNVPGIAVYSLLLHGTIAPGRYFLSGDPSFQNTIWDDARTWWDTRVWEDQTDTVKSGAVIYPLVVHPDPSACIRAGGKLYIRYWNTRGAWSYTLLDVLHNTLKAKTEYADSWRLDATPVNGRIIGDRVQTDKEMTYTITAGRDGLDRLDVDELRDMQRAYCVQVWDIDREVWRDCYVQDATTQNNGGRGQEMTFTIEMPHEYTFTR